MDSLLFLLMYRILVNIKAFVEVFSLCEIVVNNHLLNILMILLFLIPLIKSVSIQFLLASPDPYLLDCSPIFQALTGVSSMLVMGLIM